jgi:hypothetical protein
MPTDEFNPGFRLSTLDAFVLVVGGAFAANLAIAHVWFGVAIAFAIGHFFSFELLWAAAFVGLAVGTARGWWSWLTALGVSLTLTVVLVAVELRKPSYHGAFWRWVNPELPEWWEERQRGAAKKCAE